MTGAAQRVVSVRYFASLRETVGTTHEDVALPAHVETVADLIAHLSARSDASARAFAAPHVIRAALDHVHVQPDTPLGAAREIAFFPPVTGG